MFDLRKIYLVVNLKTIRPKKMSYVGEFATWDLFKIESLLYLTQNVIFHIKSHVTKHEFWVLLILKSQHPLLPNLTWNETRNDTSLKKNGCMVEKSLTFWV